MCRKLHKHTYHYILLSLILLTGLIAFFTTSEKSLRFFIGVFIAMSYTLWGIFHHYFDKDLNWKIVVEYSSFALFAISALWAFLFL